MLTTIIVFGHEHVRSARVPIVIHLAHSGRAKRVAATVAAAAAALTNTFHFKSHTHTHEHLYNVVVRALSWRCVSSRRLNESSDTYTRIWGDLSETMSSLFLFSIEILRTGGTGRRVAYECDHFVPPTRAPHTLRWPRRRPRRRRHVVVVVRCRRLRLCVPTYRQRSTSIRIESSPIQT